MLVELMLLNKVLVTEIKPDICSLLTFGNSRSQECSNGADAFSGPTSEHDYFQSIN